MKSTEIHRIFDTVMDKSSYAATYGSCPAFLPEEKDLFLNQSYEEIIMNKFTGDNPSKIPFGKSLKRVADLLKLVKTEYGLGAYSGINDLNTATMIESFDTKDRWILLSVQLIFHENEIANCVLTDNVTANKFRETYNNKPWIEDPVATLYDDKLTIFIDMYTMNPGFHNPGDIVYKVNITYLKHPTKIDISSDIDYDEVPESVMFEVIDRAVVLALESTESNRVETKVQLNNLAE